MAEKVKIEVELDRDSLIEILEEKFGVKVKTCLNCEHAFWGRVSACFLVKDLSFEGLKIGCKDWALREVSEKSKSGSKTEGMQAYCNQCNKTVTMIDCCNGDDGDLMSVIGKCPHCNGMVSTFVGK